MPFSSFVIFVRYPVVCFDTVPSGFMLISIKHAIYMVEIMHIESDGTDVVLPGWVI